MSSLVAKGQATRLLCHASLRTHGIVKLEPGAAFFLHGVLRRRSYAAAVRRTQRITPRGPAPTPASSPVPSHRSVPTRISQEQPRLIFSSDHVPPLAEWSTALERLENKDITPTQCADGAQRYVSIATQFESQWRGDLEKKHQLSPYFLHWMGLALIASNTAPRWRLGTHMLRSASELGHMPSTLTLVRVFNDMPPRMQTTVKATTMYREAHHRFQQAVAHGMRDKVPSGDPNVFTLQGMIYAKDNSMADSGKQALIFFRRATMAWELSQQKKNTSDNPGAKKKWKIGDEGADAAPPRKPRWEWELSKVLAEAKILARSPRKQATQLKRVYCVAALELDNAHGYLMLAKSMHASRHTPIWHTCMLKAAISGEAEACRELGEFEKLAAEKATRRKERAEHELLSREWFKLAEGEDLSAFVKAGDMDGAGSAA